MYRLSYAEEADRDLQAIYDYIAEDSKERARIYLGKIEKSILQLMEYPKLGNESRYKELKALGIRMLPFENYLIFYTINESMGTINVVRVLHGAMNYRRLF